MKNLFGLLLLIVAALLELPIKLFAWIIGIIFYPVVKKYTPLKEYAFGFKYHFVFPKVLINWYDL